MIKMNKATGRSSREIILLRPRAFLCFFKKSPLSIFSLLPFKLSFV